MEFSSWNQAITLAVALLGAVLGIMNTWHAMSARRVRLKVVPAHAVAIGHSQDLFSIEVINLSSFPLTIADIGFTLESTTLRAAITRPMIIDGGAWPRRLAPRESVSAYFSPIELFRDGAAIKAAYAKTACGEMALGRSPALRQLRDAIKEVAARV